MVQYAALMLMTCLQTARLCMFMIYLPTVGSQVPAWFERSTRAYLLLVLQAARSKNDIGLLWDAVSRMYHKIEREESGEST